MCAALRRKIFSGRSARRVTSIVATNAIARPTHVVQMTVVRSLAARAEIRSGAPTSMSNPAGPPTTALRHWAPAIVVVRTPGRVDIAGNPRGTVPRISRSPVCGFTARTKAICPTGLAVSPLAANASRRGSSAESSGGGGGDDGGGGTLLGAGGSEEFGAGGSAGFGADGSATGCPCASSSCNGAAAPGEFGGRPMPRVPATPGVRFPAMRCSSPPASRRSRCSVTLTIRKPPPMSTAATTICTPAVTRTLSEDVITVAATRSRPRARSQVCEARRRCPACDAGRR